MVSLWFRDMAAKHRDTNGRDKRPRHEVNAYPSCHNHVAHLWIVYAPFRLAFNNNASAWLPSPVDARRVSREGPKRPTKVQVPMRPGPGPPDAIWLFPSSPGFGLLFLSSDSVRFRPCQPEVRIRICFAGTRSDSDRFRRARFGFGSVSPGQVRIRIGFCTTKPGSVRF